MFQNLFGQKINGVNFVAEKTVVANNGFDGLKNIGADWIAWIPYAFCDIKTGVITQNTDWQWKGETLEGTSHALKLAKEQGYKTMIKPHVWLSDNSFTGTLTLSHEKWLQWQKDYSKYILNFALLAEKHHADLFCIGTEQFAAIEHNPLYWNFLIREIRKVYSGKITYAANWDSYTKCPFWNQLDYIGIDAYFPISEKENPSVKEIETGWKQWKNTFSDLFEKYHHPILFTEFGYRSTTFNTKKPWIDVTNDSYNEACQVNALQGLFNAVWQEEWMAGGFLWKCFESSKSVLRENKKSYSVKGKLAEKTVLKHYTP